MPQETKDYYPEDYLLAAMQQTIGPLPRGIFDHAAFYDTFFTSEGDGSVQWVAPFQLTAITGRLRKAIDVPGGPLEERVETDLPHMSKADRDAFLGFIRPMLQYNPKLRPSPSQALENPFLSGV